MFTRLIPSTRSEFRLARRVFGPSRGFSSSPSSAACKGIIWMSNYPKSSDPPTTPLASHPSIRILGIKTLKTDGNPDETFGGSCLLTIEDESDDLDNARACLKTWGKDNAEKPEAPILQMWAPDGFAPESKYVNDPRSYTIINLPPSRTKEPHDIQTILLHGAKFGLATHLRYTPNRNRALASTSATFKCAARREGVKAFGSETLNMKQFGARRFDGNELRIYPNISLVPRLRNHSELKATKRATHLAHLDALASAKEAKEADRQRRRLTRMADEAREAVRRTAKGSREILQEVKGRGNHRKDGRGGVLQGAMGEEEGEGGTRDRLAIKALKERLAWVEGQLVKLTKVPTKGSTDSSSSSSSSSSSPSSSSPVKRTKPMGTAAQPMSSMPRWLEKKWEENKKMEEQETLASSSHSDRSSPRRDRRRPDSVDKWGIKEREALRVGRTSRESKEDDAFWGVQGGWGGEDDVPERGGDQGGRETQEIERGRGQEEQEPQRGMDGRRGGRGFNVDPIAKGRR